MKTSTAICCCSIILSCLLGREVIADYASDNIGLYQLEEEPYTMAKRSKVLPFRYGKRSADILSEYLLLSSLRKSMDSGRDRLVKRQQSMPFRYGKRSGLFSDLPASLRQSAYDNYFESPAEEA